MTESKLFKIALVSFIFSLLLILNSFLSAWTPGSNLLMSSLLGIVCWLIFECISFYILCFYLKEKKRATKTVWFLFVIHIAYLGWFLFGDSIKKFLFRAEIIEILFVIPVMFRYILNQYYFLAWVGVGSLLVNAIMSFMVLIQSKK